MKFRLCYGDLLLRVWSNISVNRYEFDSEILKKFDGMFTKRGSKRWSFTPAMETSSWRSDLTFLRIDSKSILKFWRNLMAFPKVEASLLLRKPLFEGLTQHIGQRMARFLKGRNWNELAFFPMWPRLIFLTGWIHPVRKFVFCLFSNSWFWYFRMVNDLEFGLCTIFCCFYNKRISGRWVFIQTPRQIWLMLIATQILQET